MFKCIFVAALFVPVSSIAEEFKSLLSKVEKHPNVEIVRQDFAARASSIGKAASLKDPSLRLSAINIPTSSLSFDRTPMSSRQVMISQTLPLSSRLLHLDDQEEMIRAAGRNRLEFEAVYMRSKLWMLAAKRESLTERRKIVEESLQWLKSVERSTERLYQTGKTSQINLLEIKVRLADLESQKENLMFKTSETESQIGFLASETRPVSTEAVPWDYLEILAKESTTKENHEERALKNEVEAAQSNMNSARLSYVPDLTIGASYAIRENVDGQGDFVSGFVQVSLPLWGKSENHLAVAKARAAKQKHTLDRYRLNKAAILEAIDRELISLRAENRLVSKSIEYAETERRLAAKRYSLGRMKIFELLEIELKLRKKKNRKEVLLEKLRNASVRRLLLNGSDLNV